MATQYDSSLIETFADRLYAQAKSIIMKYSLILGLMGAVVAGGIAVGAKISAMLPVILGAVVGGAIGYSFAQEKAYQLRLQAQTALCQVQIEKNTRKGE